MFGTAPGIAQTVSSLEAEALVMASDNPFLLPGDDNQAVAAELRVNPEVTWTLPPSTTVQLSGSAAYRQYSRRYGDFLTGYATASADHRDSEYFSYGVQASIARDLPVDALTQSIDFAADSRSVRERLLGRIHGRWTPDSLTSITGSASWEELRYPGSAILSSTTAYQADLGASRRVSAMTSVGWIVRATRSKMSGAGSASATGVFATIAHRFGPHVDGDAELGVEWSDFSLGDGKRARVSGSGNLCYRPALTDLCVNASLQSEVSGFAGLQREFHVGLTGNQQLNALNDLSVAAEYQRSEIDTLGLQSEAMRLNTTYRHRLGERLSLIGSVDYLAREFLDTSRNDAVMVRIGVSFERFDSGDAD